MFDDLQQRVKKAGQAPGTAIYTGTQKDKKMVVTLTTFDANHCQVIADASIDQITAAQSSEQMMWISIDGLSDVDRIKNITKKLIFSVEQVSIIVGKKFVLSFLESGTNIFNPILEKLQMSGDQRLRQQTIDYLAYRLIDAIVDEYFIVLEGLGEQIETVESRIISSPTPQNARTIYRLKRQILVLRKAIWPMREAISHLLYAEEILITKNTRVYLRDVYDHTMQAIDTIETFRDMLSSMLDMYLSGLTIRMNEIMKTLTIITTIFIPITALASIYGMNLPNIPLMKSHRGFIFVAAMMTASVTFMVLYFRKKKWI